MLFALIRRFRARHAPPPATLWHRLIATHIGNATR